MVASRLSKVCLFGFEPDDPNRAHIQDLDVISVLDEADSPSSFGDWAQRLGDEIDFVIVHLDHRDKLAIIEQLTSILPRCRVIAAGPPDSTLIVSAMRLGCAQFVPVPIDPQDLRSAIASAKTDRGETWETKRLCVIGTSGGSGATTISCSLAAELGAQGSSVAIVDLDLEFGGVACAFDCVAEHTLASLCSKAPVDKDMVRSSLVDLPDNISILARPNDMEQIYEVTPDKLKVILDILNTLFPYVIIDMSRINGELGHVALQDADRILIVLQSSVMSVRNANRILKILNKTGVDPDKIEAVINRSQSRDAHGAFKELASYVKCPVYTRVPNDYSQVQSSLDRGVMAVSNKGSQMHAAIREIAARLTGIDIQANNAPHGWLGRLLGLIKPAH